MPVGCSTGTSAAVSVALIGALDRLTPGQLTPGEVARCAHRIETDLLKQQCGVQDQLAAAYGGVNFIEILDYPHSIVSPIRLPESMHWELQRRLSLIYVGQSHSSSKVHESVIRRLEDAGPDAAELAPLREIPLRVRDALYGGDFPALARAMIENTDAQANLHPDLLSPRHAAVIDVARQNGAIGWKLNGAGGDGGSVTLLSGPDTAERRGMVREIEAALPECRSIPILLSPLGLRTWDTPVEGLHGPRFVI
jgi:D-glycero-alpha-D-manno-heptose-7-phosphate kinase